MMKCACPKNKPCKCCVLERKYENVREGKVSMILKDLKQYRSICAEIEELNMAITSKTVNNTVTGSDSCFPYTKHSMSVGGLTYTDENRRLLIKLHRLEWKRDEIEDYIESIEDSLTRRMFKMRFIQGCSWAQVAHRTNNTTDSARMKCIRYMDKKGKKVL